MRENLDKIENWLAVNANRISQFSLQNPATEIQITALEKEIGQSLPPDFKDLYRWHNGINEEENIGSLFYGMDFLSIESMLANYEERRDNPLEKSILQKADPQINAKDVNNAKWLKFGFDNSHCSLYLDLDPAENGKAGQIIFIDDEYEVGILVANNTAELVANFAKDLEENRYHLDEDALEDGNHFLETIPEIDLVNWEMSDLWNH